MIGPYIESFSSETGLVIVSYKDSISPYSYVLRDSLSLSLSLHHLLDPPKQKER